MQLEFVCKECPLSECDEQSLWCVLRMLTQPNVVQQQYIKKPFKIRRKKRSKKQYNAQYYRENIEAKREYDRQRYLERRMNNV